MYRDAMTLDEALAEATRIEEGRQLIAQLDAYLAVGDTPARNLWALLTALRGPDYVDDDSRHAAKHQTTAPIRSILLPKTREEGGIGADFNPPEALVEEQPSHEHFYRHIRDAVLALKRMGYLKYHREVSSA